MHPSTHRASFSIGSEIAAKRIVDVLTEVFFEDDAAVAAFEQPNGQWDVALHFANAPDRAWLRELVATSAGNEIADTLAFDTVEARDWVKSSLEDLVPVPGGRFVVHGSHDRDRVAPNKLAIEIEAALAFGTGHHGTTRGCLLAMDTMMKRNKPRRILDLGTGSGVLAIAAAKILRTRVLATDIDRRAVRIARANARGNHVGALVETVQAAGFAAPRVAARAHYDLVVANILLKPLQRMAAPLARRLAPGGRVVLSGLLSVDANAALAAYRAQGLALERRLKLEDWVTLVMKRSARR